MEDIRRRHIASSKPRRESLAFALYTMYIALRRAVISNHKFDDVSVLRKESPSHQLRTPRMRYHSAPTRRRQAAISPQCTPRTQISETIQSSKIDLAIAHGVDPSPRSGSPHLVGEMWGCTCIRRGGLQITRLVHQ